MHFNLNTYSRKGLEKLLEDDLYTHYDVFVFVAEPGEESPDLKGGAVHRVDFAGELTDAQCTDLINFIVSSPENCNIRLCCASGQSTSVAIADALRKIVEENVPGATVKVKHNAGKCAPSASVYKQIVRTGVPLLKKRFS